MSDERCPPTLPEQKSGAGFKRGARADEIRPPKLDERLSVMAYGDGRSISIEPFALVVLAALTLVWIGGSYFFRLVANGPPQFDDTTVKAVVERIILAESDGKLE